MSQIVEDFKEFTDKFGLIQPSHNGQKGGLISPSDGQNNGVITSQNGTLFSVQYIICLADNNDPKLHEEARRLKYVFETCEPEIGLSCRHPESREIDSMDNTVALLTFSAIYGKGRFAKRMYDRGELRVKDGLDLHDQPEKTQKMYKWAKLLNFGFAPKHVWNVHSPTRFNIRAWWGRSPAMLGLSRMTAGKFCNPFLWLSVLVGQFVGVFKHPEDSDSRTLPYVVWHYLKTRSVFWRLMYKLWYYLAFTRYNYSLKQVYTNYFTFANYPLKKHTNN